MRKLATLVAPVLVFVGLVAFASSARADSDVHTFRGVVSKLDTSEMTFTLVTPHSGNVIVILNGDTQYTDKDGSVRHFSDLNSGDKLKIKGEFSDSANLVNNVDQVIFNSDK